MWNAISLVQDLNSCRRVHFLRRWPLHHGQSEYCIIFRFIYIYSLVLVLCRQPDVNLGWFRSRLGASHVSTHTEELWYKETVSLWMTIYIWRKKYVPTYIQINVNYTEYDEEIVTKIKITLTSHFIRYIYQNCMKISWNIIFIQRNRLRLQPLALDDFGISLKPFRHSFWMNW